MDESPKTDRVVEVEVENQSLNLKLVSMVSEPVTESNDMPTIKQSVLGGESIIVERQKQPNEPVDRSKMIEVDLLDK